MSLCTPSLLLQPFLTTEIPDFHQAFAARVIQGRRRATNRIGPLNATANAAKNESDDKPTKLVTFLGKGGSGKTTAAIFAAQHYAMAGFNTCLTIHSQDPTAEYLLNCKIGPSVVKCNDNLSAMRLETTRMILEPLKRLKQADAHINLTQGVLEGVVGEELGVLPGMDSIFSVLELERILGFLVNTVKRNGERGKFDVVIYDGKSTEETIRMIGATGKARLYLKYMRNLAEKTDLGRVITPSIMRLVDESLSLIGKSISLNGGTSSEIWDFLEKALEKGSSAFAEPERFGCYIVMDPTNPLSLNSATRYWGCAIQAGAQISGAFGIASPNFPEASVEMSTKFSPLPCTSIPYIKFGDDVKWNDVMMSAHSKDARNLLSVSTNMCLPSVEFDPKNKTVTLFMPGFDKSEIKLYQFRGGSELLVEAGDQRRVIRLPSQIQGKVGGAKFINRNLIITLR